jgi:DNA-binding NarL/FixJ family response regulator
MTERTRVLVVDDHPVFRYGLRRLLDASSHCRVVGEAGDAPAARRLLLDVRVDVVTVDIRLEKGSGLDLIAAIRAERPDVRVLVISMTDEDLFAPRALRLGARGFVSKGASPEALVEAVVGVAAGGVMVSDRVRQRLVEDACRPFTDVKDPLAMLTNREVEVFSMIGRGHSTVEIASSLGVSPKTVETHRLGVARKLGLRGTAALVRAAVAALGDGIGERP